MKSFLLFLIFFTSAAKANVINLEVKENRMSCHNGKLKWGLKNNYPTKFNHRNLVFDFKDQLSCYRFILDTVRKYSPKAIFPLFVTQEEKEVVTMESYKYNCRWVGGGHAGPRQFCQRGTREVKYIYTYETIKVFIDTIELNSKGVKTVRKD